MDTGAVALLDHHKQEAATRGGGDQPGAFGAGCRKKVGGGLIVAATHDRAGLEEEEEIAAGEGIGLDFAGKQLGLTGAILDVEMLQDKTLGVAGGKGEDEVAAVVALGKAHDRPLQVNEAGGGGIPHDGNVKARVDRA